MLLPGRVPGYKSSDVKLLPSSTTKHAIWELYLQAAATSVMRAVAYSTFTQLWRQLLPHVVVMKPMSDLCWVCQQNSTAIMRAANRPVEEKSIVSACACMMCNVCTRCALISYPTIHVHVCRLSDKPRVTLLTSPQRGRCTGKLWRRPSHLSLLTSPQKEPSLHHHLQQKDHLTTLPSMPTTVLTWHSRCSTPTTLSSLAQCTS